MFTSCWSWVMTSCTRLATLRSSPYALSWWWWYISIALIHWERKSINFRDGKYLYSPYAPSKWRGFCATVLAIIMHAPFIAVPPDCLLDRSLGSHEYVTANGIKFHYVTAGDRSKPLMLFLHGFPEVWIITLLLHPPINAIEITSRFQGNTVEKIPIFLPSYAVFVCSLENVTNVTVHVYYVHSPPSPMQFWFSWRYQLPTFSKDYHVVAIDMRGYGETERPPNKNDYTMDSAIQDVVELIPALGHSKCILVGHGGGGAVAW